MTTSRFVPEFRSLFPARAMEEVRVGAEFALDFLDTSDWGRLVPLDTCVSNAAIRSTSLSFPAVFFVDWVAVVAT